MTKSSYDGLEPQEIFVVAWDAKFRIYVKEGHALNWLCKKKDEGHISKLYKYEKTEILGG